MTHLRIIGQSGVEDQVNATVVQKLYTAALSVANNSGTIDLQGVIYSPTVYKDAYEYLSNQTRFPNFTIKPPTKIYIPFEDPVVASIMNTWCSNSSYFNNSYEAGDGIGVTEQEAANLRYLGDQWVYSFNGNTQIRTFNEFKYFYGLTKRRSYDNGGIFANSSIEEIDLTNHTNLAGGGKYVFERCSNLRSIGNTTTITHIGDGCFSRCSSLAINVNFPNLQTLGSDSFSRSGILSITNLGNISSIPGRPSNSNSGEVFSNCGSLTIVDLSTTTSLQTIGRVEFSECGNLKKVILPASLQSIGDYGFDKARQLQYVKCLATTPPTLGTQVFGQTNSTFKIYVPDSTNDTILNAYKAASGWSDYASRIYSMSQFATDFPND